MVRPMTGSAHADGWFGPIRKMVRPTSLSLLNSVTVDSAHSSSGNLLRFFLTVGGGLDADGQIFNFPLECSTTSWQGSFVAAQKLLSTPMSI